MLLVGLGRLFDSVPSAQIVARPKDSITAASAVSIPPECDPKGLWKDIREYSQDFQNTPQKQEGATCDIFAHFPTQGYEVGWRRMAFEVQIRQKPLPGGLFHHWVLFFRLGYSVDGGRYGDATLNHLPGAIVVAQLNPAANQGWGSGASASASSGATNRLVPDDQLLQCGWLQKGEEASWEAVTDWSKPYQCAGPSCRAHLQEYHSQIDREGWYHDGWHGQINGTDRGGSTHIPSDFNFLACPGMGSLQSFTSDFYTKHPKYSILSSGHDEANCQTYAASVYSWFTGCHIGTENVALGDRPWGDFGTCIPMRDKACFASSSKGLEDERCHVLQTAGIQMWKNDPVGS